MTAARVHPLFAEILRVNGLPQKVETGTDYFRRQALLVEQQVMVEQLDRACRLEIEIEELAADLRDARHDWDEGTLTRALATTRTNYAEAVTQAGIAMAKVSTLRAELNLPEHPMVAIPKVAERNGAPNPRSKQS